MEPGYKTTEFWAMAIVAGLGAAIAFPDGTPMWKVISGVAMAVLPVLFYTHQRTGLKAAQIDADSAATVAGAVGAAGLKS